MKFVPHRKHKVPCLLRGQLYFTYMYEVRTSQEAQGSTVCYGDSFTLLICMKFVPHRKHKVPLSVTGTVLLYLHV
jgi:hypothetical protein